MTTKKKTFRKVISVEWPEEYGEDWMDQILVRDNPKVSPAEIDYAIIFPSEESLPAPDEHNS